MTRRFLAAFTMTLAAFVVVQAAPKLPPIKTNAKKAAGSDTSIGDPKAVIRDSAVEQDQLRRRFASFKKRLLILAQRLEKSRKIEDREKAKTLKEVLKRISEKGIESKFTGLKGKLKDKEQLGIEQLQSIMSENKELRAELKTIIEMLLRDDPFARLKAERERTEALLEELKELIARQERVRAQTEIGRKDKDELGKAQNKVTRQTGDLIGEGKKGGKGADAKKAGESKGAGKGGKAGRGEAKNDTGDRKGDSKAREGKGTEGKDGKDGKGEGKGASGKDGKGEGKDSKGKDGKGDGKPGKKGEGKPGMGKPGMGKKGEGKPGMGKKGSSGKPGKPGAGKSSKGSKGEGKPSAGKSGSKSGSGKPSSGKGSSGKPSAGKKGPQKSDSKAKSEGKSSAKGKKSSSKSGMPGDKSSKSSSGKSGGKSSGKGSSSSKSGGKSGSSGSSGNSGNQNNQNQNQEENPVKKQVQDANKYQRAAEDDLKKDDKDKASDNQTKALDKLNEAKKKLEELLKQLREEEIERLLAKLQQRCQYMLQLQIEVRNGTVRLDGEVKAILKEEPKDDLRAQKQTSLELSDKEHEIVKEARAALRLLEAEGSAVAFAEVFKQVLGDMEKVEGWLRKMDTGRITVATENDIIETLKEMVEALKKARKQNKNKGKPKPGQPKSGQPADPKLIDLIAELKMIRSMQMRVNRRTKLYGDEYKDLEQTPSVDAAKDAKEAEKIKRIQSELKDLADRQAKIARVTDDIAKGKNEKR